MYYNGRPIIANMGANSFAVPADLETGRVATVHCSLEDEVSLRGKLSGTIRRALSFGP